MTSAPSQTSPATGKTSDAKVLDIAVAERRVAAALARFKPTTIPEKDFFDAVVALCAAGRHGEAGHFIIANAGRLLESSLNPKEKLNNLYYLSRLTQAGGGNKHGPEKLLRKVAGLEKHIAGLELPAGGGFIELGCGAHDPLALSTYFYLNGFEPTFGVDLLEPRNALFSAFSMYDILSNAKCFPERYLRKGSDLATLIERIGHFDIAAFERGDFWAGFARVADKVRFVGKDIAESDIPMQSVSLLASFAVLEHVSDIAGICQTIRNVVRPGGIVYHFVDLADHRAYRGKDALSPFHFLSEEVPPANLNRLRAFEVTAAHVAAGFEVLSDQRNGEPIPPAIMAALQPKFRAMSVEDLAVTKQVLVLRRP